MEYIKYIMEYIMEIPLVVSALVESAPIEEGTLTAPIEEETLFAPIEEETLFAPVEELLPEVGKKRKRDD